MKQEIDLEGTSGEKAVVAGEVSLGLRLRRTFWLRYFRYGNGYGAPDNAGL